MAEVFGTGWRQRVFWTTAAYDFVAHENGTRTTRCRQGSHAGAPVLWGVIYLSALLVQNKYD
jgi:hypothetical protein